MTENELDLNDFYLDEIIEIIEIGETDTIDITVADTNLFFIENGVYAHNSGANSEIITMEQIAEAYSKCFPADFIFTISRTIKDRQNNTGKMFICKSRSGKDGCIFPMFIDTSCVKLEVLSELAYDDHSEKDDSGPYNDISSAEYKQKLAAKYKNSKNDA